jgi:type II secretory pathway pseudopilin PulG
VLLEVILALVLFVAAAAVVSSGVGAAMQSVDRQRMELHAVNLAVSVLSEIQMGTRSLQSPGPDKFPRPFEAWSWQTAAAPAEDDLGEASSLTRVEIIIRHANPDVTYRLAQWIPAAGGASPSTSTPGAEVLP